MKQEILLEDALHAHPSPGQDHEVERASCTETTRSRSLNAHVHTSAALPQSLLLALLGHRLRSICACFAHNQHFAVAFIAHRLTISTSYHIWSLRSEPPPSTQLLLSLALSLVLDGLGLGVLVALGVLVEDVAGSKMRNRLSCLAGENKKPRS